MLRKFKLFFKRKRKVVLKFRFDFDLVKGRWKFSLNK